MFQTLAIQNGTILRDYMEVKDIRKDGVEGGVWVYTSNGEKFWGKKCVVTVGAWTTKLVKTVSGIDLPTQPLETMVCYWRIKEGHEDKYAIGGDFPTLHPMAMGAWNGIRDFETMGGKEAVKLGGFWRAHGSTIVHVFNDPDEEFVIDFWVGSLGRMLWLEVVLQGMGSR
ncbi:hypothetical protein CMV_000703 [Castanea mollissima]|uniref:FAD dependent oxidoreductase domain-containing protein n=1 Tax=Castanea mollissima TaxID=60419 RepID=A0A8J4RM35_9ROSI|nr:hypothetical protein CMV_000703 [Castanea mollissima]